jgi:hypothetical protein
LPTASGPYRISAMPLYLVLLSPGFWTVKRRFLNSLVTLSASPAVLVPLYTLMVTSAGSSGRVTSARGAPAGQSSPFTAPPWVSFTRAAITNTNAATASTPTTTSARTRAKLMGLAPGSGGVPTGGERDLSRG